MVGEEICPTCSGSGKVKCEYCDGAGGEWKVSGGEKVWDECPVCRGSGEMTCKVCRGEGGL